MNAPHVSCPASIHAETMLTQLCQSFQLGSQLADASMRSVDSYLAQLHDLGLFNSTIVVGPIVINRAYGVAGPGDSGELIQAAVTTDRGTAAVVWNSDDYADLKDHDEFLREALSRARPLCDCLPAIRSMVWPHIGLLLVQLIAQGHLS